jgi:hypothetical protein
MCPMDGSIRYSRSSNGLRHSSPISKVVILCLASYFLRHPHNPDSLMLGLTRRLRRPGAGMLALDLQIDPLFRPSRGAEQISRDQSSGNHAGTCPTRLCVLAARNRRRLAAHKAGGVWARVCITSRRACITTATLRSFFPPRRERIPPSSFLHRIYFITPAHALLARIINYLLSKST